MTIGIRSRSSGRQSSPVGLLIFGTIWTLFSSIFVFLGLGSARDGVGRSTWTEVPCIIEKCEILDNPAEDRPFAMDVVFRYNVDGREYTGKRWKANDARYEDYHKLAEERLEVLAGGAEPGGPRGRETICHVNPEDPADAVLVVSGGEILGGVIFAVFGGCFVLIGIGLLAGAVKAILANRAAANGQVAITAAKTAGDGSNFILYPFFGLFAIAGLGLMFGLILPSWQKYFAAKSWVEVPAEVIWSKVARHSGSKGGSTYSHEIFYRYSFDGEEYKSDKGSFFDGSSSGHEAKERAAKAHPKGSEIKVYVNPAKPWQAVRDRDMGMWAWFTLFPLPFIAVGCGGLFWLLKKRGAARTITGEAKLQRAAATPSVDPTRDHDQAGHGLRLAPGKGRLAKAGGLLFVTLFWNGIVSVFLYHLVGEARTGDFPWFMALFLVPFVLIGLGILAGFIHQVGAVFNPKPVLVITPGRIQLGRTINVHWEVAGGASRLSDLVILIRGEEVATYRRGTNTVTERATFFEKEIARAEMAAMIAGGRAALSLPEDLVPSWKADNNRIEWTIQIKGTIRFWPDINDSHVLQVHPH